MFGKRKKQTEKKEFDAKNYKAILKCSICNGEQVLGFRNLQTGKYEEIAFIRSEKELREILDSYGITEVEKVY